MQREIAENPSISVLKVHGRSLHLLHHGSCLLYLPPFLSVSCPLCFCCLSLLVSPPPPLQNVYFYMSLWPNKQTKNTNVCSFLQIIYRTSTSVLITLWLCYVVSWELASLCFGFLHNTAILMALSCGASPFVQHAASIIWCTAEYTEVIKCLMWCSPFYLMSCLQ